MTTEQMSMESADESTGPWQVGIAHLTSVTV